MRKRNTRKNMKNAQQSYLQTETFDFRLGTVRLFAQNEFKFIPLFLGLFLDIPCIYSLNSKSWKKATTKATA